MFWLRNKKLNFYLHSYLGTLVRPNKEISVFRVTGLKNLGRVGTLFFSFSFLTELPFKMHKIIFFQKT